MANTNTSQSIWLHPSQKKAFYDALCLRYGWSSPHPASLCVSCGQAFTIGHTLSCCKYEQETHRAYEQRVRESNLKSLDPSRHWSLLQVVEWANATNLLQAASRTSCTEVTPALQHHYGMASHMQPWALHSCNQQSMCLWGR